MIYGGFGELPGCTAVKQDGIWIGIEDPDFGVVGVCCRSPDCNERSERASGSKNKQINFILKQKKKEPQNTPKLLKIVD